MIPFPDYGECDAKAYLDGLRRLLNDSILETDYVDAKSAAALVAGGLKAYRDAAHSPEWQEHLILSTMPDGDKGLNLICAALFDLVCNAEYVRGRMENKGWIYCNKNHGFSSDDIHAYYSFLKQCPTCCLESGLEVGKKTGITGSQHKPTSHVIGEITTVGTVLFAYLLGVTGSRRFEVATVKKQSHDADAVMWSDDLVVLLEIKSSPLVSYPFRVKLNGPFRSIGADDVREIRNHSLVDIDFLSNDVSLYLANTSTDIPLPRNSEENWPYKPLVDYISRPEGLITYFGAWYEIFRAYRIPKTRREDRSKILAYLANGWGDQIDSNKTKAGLGRTDDIKKGTYQLLKFGAYYRQGSPNLAIRGALTANLDPLFMFDDYMAKLIDGRWAPEGNFSEPSGDGRIRTIRDADLYRIYDAVLAFSRPIINDPLLQDCFDFQRLHEVIRDGGLDYVLEEWSSWI